jgi:hypothetical protein
VASELAKAFDTDVNGLPLSLDLSWLEQKAVAVLLTLLHLGVKNIRWAHVGSLLISRTLQASGCGSHLRWLGGGGGGHVFQYRSSAACCISGLWIHDLLGCLALYAQSGQ